MDPGVQLVDGVGRHTLADFDEKWGEGERRTSVMKTNRFRDVSDHIARTFGRHLGDFRRFRRPQSFCIPKACACGRAPLDVASAAVGTMRKTS